MNVFSSYGYNFATSTLITFKMFLISDKHEFWFDEVKVELLNAVSAKVAKYEPFVWKQ